jgi:hypothetical protein
MSLHSFEGRDRHPLSSRPVPQLGPLEADMSTCGTTIRRLPFLRDFPDEARQSIETASSDQEKRRREAGEARSRKAEEVAGRARAHVRDLLGPRNLDALRQLMRHERLAFRDLACT